MKYFPAMLAILFIALKLTHYIGWSWWYVTAPLWAPIVLWLVVALAALILQGVGLLMMGKEGRARHRVAKAMERYGAALSRKP